MRAGAGAGPIARGNVGLRGPAWRAHAAGAAPDFPTTLIGDGLTLWVRADMGVTLDGFGSVQSWDDSSGAGICPTFAQGNAGDRPIYVANGIGGKPHVENDAGGEVLIGNTALLATIDLTMWSVFRTSSAAADRCIFGMRYNAHVYSLNVGYSVAGRCQYVDYDATIATSDNAVNDGNAHAVILTRSKLDPAHPATTGQSIIRIDGTDPSAVTGATADTIVNVANDCNSILGLAHSAAVYGQGMIGALSEAGICNRVLAGGEIASLWSYLQTRYGL